MIRSTLIVLFLIGSMAPAASKTETTNSVAAQEIRLSAIGYRLAEANAAFCPKRERIAGASLDQPPICSSKFWVDSRSKKDAGADGEQVRVTSGLIDFLSDDDELAAVAAHELAHNQLGHPQLMENLKKGRGKVIREHEIAADRLAVWLLANAGYDPRATIRLWTRLGPAKSKTPKLSERLAILQTEIAALDSVTPTEGKRAPPLLVKDATSPHFQPD